MHSRGERGLTIIIILTNNQLLQLAVLAHLAPHVLVESIKVVLQLAGVHPILGIESRILVHVGHQDGLRVRRLDVFPRASVAVSAGADFVVEGAIDLVLLGAENGCEVVGHIGWWTAARGFCWLRRVVYLMRKGCSGKEILE